MFWRRWSVISATNTEIEALAQTQGVIFLGATTPEYPQAYERFEGWIGEGRHGSMGFLENHASLRQDPEKLLPGAQAVLSFALPYYQPPEPKPRVALYAQYSDYHRVLRRKLESIAEALFAAESWRVLVDSAPVLERALAAKTSEGFIGKNTLYIHPKHGSFLLLGEILTLQKWSADVPPEIPLDRKTRAGGCGPCRLCQTACPTGALQKDYSLDARRCLSYWTIEHRGAIPEEFWPWLAEYYFGCDLCQLACPYNKHAASAPVGWERRAFPDLFETATMDQARYESAFGGTPMTRAKREGLRRNALIALAVLEDKRLGQALAHIDSDPSPVLQETREQIRRFKPALCAASTQRQPTR
ncbi:tRNA epoxyqueuosine(34) reductase QueG [bacterium]|nr:tRNA epoxyqueuosine(34) reductase QueG [bacterium]